jgi:hypothetical protein
VATSLQEKPLVHSIPFDIISRLLLGHQYSKEYVADSALLSSWGWSIFFDSLAAHDPANVRPGLIHLQLGVPSRNGERKARIVDAPADTPVEFGGPLDEHDKTLIAFWPGEESRQWIDQLVANGSDE